MWLVSIIVLILMLGILVLLHEFGHFIVARLCGVHVYEFSVGMGPLLCKHISKKSGIQYSLRALPIGGYVQLAGEVMEDDDKIPKEKLMCNKPWWQRILILSAGVIMNFITAFVLLFMIGLIYGSTSTTPKINNVLEGSAFSEAGGRSGDVILSIDGKKTKTWDRAQVLLTLDNKKDYYSIEVRHEDNTTETLKVAPKETTDEKGNKSRVFGVTIYQETYHGVGKALSYAASKFESIYQSMFTIIYGLFTGRLSMNSLSGPVGMYNIVNQSLALGLAQILYLTAYFSINLGFMNFLPFPAFDGGHILFVLIEKIRGKRVDTNIEGWFHTIGFILLMLLMIFITIKDIIGLF